MVKFENVLLENAVDSRTVFVKRRPKFENKSTYAISGDLSARRVEYTAAPTAPVPMIENKVNS